MNENDTKLEDIAEGIIEAINHKIAIYDLAPLDVLKVYQITASKFVSLLRGDNLVIKKNQNQEIKQEKPEEKKVEFIEMDQEKNYYDPTLKDGGSPPSDTYSAIETDGKIDPKKTVMALKKLIKVKFQNSTFVQAMEEINSDSSLIKDLSNLGIEDFDWLKIHLDKRRQNNITEGKVKVLK